MRTTPPAAPPVRPSLVVPLVHPRARGLLDAARTLAAGVADLVEWRADHFDGLDDAGTVVALTRELAGALDVPLVFTVRTRREGGAADLPADGYADLLAAVADDGAAAWVDVEADAGDDVVRRVVAAAHRRGVRVVVSHHNFSATPTTAEILDRLGRMRALGADLPKIAVMPGSPRDVLTLLDATWTYRSDGDRPLVTMAMGALGVVSRLGTFGSAWTFASAGAASAPGQLPAELVRQVLDAGSAGA